MSPTQTFAQVSPTRIRRNENNPRRLFDDERMDLLRTSIQENSIQVPLTVYSDPQRPDHFVLMDGERRWRSALELGFSVVPVDVIDAPEPLQNLLHISNIQAAGDDWPLISVALWLRQMINLSGANSEANIVEMSGLPRNVVRRARRLLSLPQYELDLIQSEAHLARQAQVHRDDLYLEIESAEALMRAELPEVADRFTRDEIIRRLAQKREVGSLRSATELREIGRLIKSVRTGIVSREDAVSGVIRMLEDPYLAPAILFREVASARLQEQSIGQQAAALARSLGSLDEGVPVPDGVRSALEDLRKQVGRVLG